MRYVSNELQTIKFQGRPTRAGLPGSRVEAMTSLVVEEDLKTDKKLVADFDIAKDVIEQEPEELCVGKEGVK